VNEGVEKFLLRLRDQIEPPRIRIVHEGGAGAAWHSLRQRYPGDGNRLARRSAAKGRPRLAVYEVTRSPSPNEVSSRP